MKRIFKIALISIILMFLSTSIVFSQNSVEYDEDLKQIENQLLEDIEVNRIKDNIPSSIEQILDDYNLDTFTSDGVLDLSFTDFFKMIFSGFMYKLREPLSILATMLAVILLSSLLNNFENTFNQNSLSQTFEIVSILCVSGFVVTPIIEILKEITKLIEQISSFLLSFIPVFAGIITVSGKPITAFSYNSILMIVIQSVSVVSSSILLPLCSCYLALVICSCVTNQIDISNLIKTIKTILMWTLGFLMTIFVAILTIKSFVSSSADTVTMKATKYVTGSFIPVVGNAISDTLSVVQASVGVIKSSIGAFGIIVILLCFIPSILSIVIMNFSIKFAQIVADMLGVKKVSSLLNATSFVLNFMQSILLCYGIMIIISISLMLVIGVGT